MDTQLSTPNEAEIAALAQSATNPAAVYLASLGSERSRTDLALALNKVAGLISDGRHSIESFPWATLGFEHVTGLKSLLQKRGSAPASVNLYLSAVKGVCKAAWNLGQMSTDQYHRLKAVSGVKATRLPRGRALAANELTRLHATCDDDMQFNRTKALRDAAILAVLYSSAAPRRAELVALDLADWQPAESKLIVRSGKGDKDRLGFLARNNAEALEAWIEARGSEPGPLFKAVNRGGRIVEGRMSPQSVRYVLQERAQLAGIENCSPHDIRRSVGSDMLDRGADLSVVAECLGHASTDTTRRGYDRRGERAVKRAAQLVNFPVGG